MPPEYATADESTFMGYMYVCRLLHGRVTRTLTTPGVAWDLDKPPGINVSMS
jgi:hypothetical protein